MLTVRPAVRLLLVSLAISVSPVNSANASQLELVLSPADTTPGTTVRMPIRAVASAQVGAIQLDLIYDPGVLEFRGVESGPLLSSALMESNVAVPGKVRIALASSEAVTGEGTLLFVEFIVQNGPPTQTTVRLEDIHGWDLATNLILTTHGREADVSRKDESASTKGAGLPGAESPPWKTVWILLTVIVALLTVIVIVLLARRHPSTNRT